MSGLGGGTSDIPFVCPLCLAGSNNVFARLGLKIEALVPIAGNILDKLEGIHLFLVVLNDVGCHLERTVKRNVECKLACKRRPDLAGIIGNPFAEVHHEDAGRVVHRSAYATGKRKNCSMVYRVATKTFVFRTAGTLVSYPVRPCTANAGGTSGFMGVHHDMVFSRLFYGI